jgi:hypothetical protein
MSAGAGSGGTGGGPSRQITATALFALAPWLSRAEPCGRIVPFARPCHSTSLSNKLLPSGTDEITVPLNRVIEVKNQSTHVSMLTSTAYDSHESRRGSVLVLDKHGDRYFLSETLCPSVAMKRKPAYFKEREAGKDAGSLGLQRGLGARSGELTKSAYPDTKVFC